MTVSGKMLFIGSVKEWAAYMYNCFTVLVRAGPA